MQTFTLRDVAAHTIPAVGIMEAVHALSRLGLAIEPGAVAIGETLNAAPVSRVTQVSGFAARAREAFHAYPSIRITAGVVSTAIVVGAAALHAGVCHWLTQLGAPASLIRKAFHTSPRQRVAKRCITLTVSVIGAAATGVRTRIAELVPRAIQMAQTLHTVLLLRLAVGSGGAALAVIGAGGGAPLASLVRLVSVQLEILGAAGPRGASQDERYEKPC